jgi:hypothetical protein
MVELIPSRCLSILPFVAEALRDWSSASDIHIYLTALFDKNAVMIGPDRKRMPINFARLAGTQ